MSETISRRRQLLNAIKVFDGGFTETYEEHSKRCEGCIYCAGYRAVDKELSKLTEQELVAREMMEEENDIAYFYSSPDDIFNEDGTLDLDVYLCLKYQDVSDNRIRVYFHIDDNTWRDFKKNFPYPNWSNKDKRFKDEIIDTAGVAAYRRWQKSKHNTHVRLSHVR
ncbi:hypothetical protein FOD75_11530 (plasmid) [Limosilactobacillus reuteri]|uniref:Uncharacterized protein n=1 Tax=Limosilactobacillus reuteri TaxID=1598 RepID=A0A517D8M7_LIMRT|nr:hypothetical protein [Limosilactobacillus reuteri]QDR73712.1 hypothetical protein FOD75_11530 [Limosilactobacillus reuteri]